MIKPETKAFERKAGTYAWMVPYISSIARERGYAIGLHGSMARDLDLMAMPWTENAEPAEALIEAIREKLGGKILPSGTVGGRWSVAENKFIDVIINNPAQKPHGRLAWNIHIDGGLYLDISVMPRICQK